MLMSGTPEREHEVDDDEEPDLRGELLDAAVAGDHERGRHQAEDRAGGADRELVRVERAGRRTTPASSETK